MSKGWYFVAYLSGFATGFTIGVIITKFFCMKNIHLLPTDKPSRLHLWTDENGSRLELCELEYSHTRNTQNIYITSDSEIKEGDWVLSFLEDESYGMPLEIEENHFNCGFDFEEDFKKIILTTDPDLIADGIQSIPDEFLEWFVRNPSCEGVETELHIGSLRWEHSKNTYKIIIPQEEPKQETSNEAKKRAKNYMKLKGALEPKQETLEEARKNRLLEELVENIKNQQSFLKSVRKNPQLYYYKFGTCIYERLYNNDNCFEMIDTYGGHSSKMEQELISLQAEKIYYE